jgi:hypothetical protein
MFMDIYLYVYKKVVTKSSLFCFLLGEVRVREHIIHQISSVMQLLFLCSDSEQVDRNCIILASDGYIEVYVYA